MHKTYEFTLIVLGAGESEGEAWEDAQAALARKVAQNVYEKAEVIHEDQRKNKSPK